MASRFSPQFVTGSSGAAVRWKSIAGVWLKNERTRFYLIALIDESSGQAVARLAAADSCHENLLLLRQYVAQIGRPRTVLTNGKTIFRGNPRGTSASGNSRIQRVLTELSIEQQVEATTSRSATASRFFRFARKHLALELTAKGAQSPEAANYFLETSFLPRWNRLCPVALGTDAHRPVETDLELAFSDVAVRKLQAGLICYHGEYYLVEPAVGESVRIEERLDGSLHGAIGNTPVRLLPHAAPLSVAPPIRIRERMRKAAIPKKPPSNKRWMDDFFQRPPRPLWSILKPSRFGD